MEPRTYVKLGTALLALIACGCGPNHQEDPTMDTNTAGLEADPQFYQLNSVMGEVTSNGQPVPDATVTIVQVKEAVAVKETGTFLIVLDPAKLGSDTHELLFAAPGFKEQRHTVVVPANNQIRLDVELQPDR